MTDTIAFPSRHAQEICEDLRPLAEDHLHEQYKRLCALYAAKQEAFKRWLNNLSYSGPPDDVEARVRHNIAKEILSEAHTNAIRAFDAECEKIFAAEPWK